MVTFRGDLPYNSRNGRARRPLCGILLGLVALASATSACGDDSLDSLDRAGTAPAPPAVESPTATGAADAPDLPGAGVEVSMARGNWSSGYMQAAIFRALLQELGYSVSDPAEAEMGPRDFYPTLARGEYDFWVNGWFPNHDEFIYGEDPEMGLPAGTVVGDHARRVGVQVPQGGLQGFLVDMLTADELGITSMADIAANPTPWDGDGDGLADLVGCPEDWGCHVVIDSIIELNGWQDSLEQIIGDYDALWDEQMARLQSGEPVLAFTWAPSAYIVQLTPGQNAYWLAVPRTMPGQEAAAALPANQCPTQPCTTGFTPADISVVANNEFLAANPATEELFKQVTIDVLDIALQNLRYKGGEDSEAAVASHAAAWIIDNRQRVDDWLTAARAAAG